MACGIEAIPMTLSDLQRHSLLQAFSSVISPTAPTAADKTSTVSQSLCSREASCQLWYLWNSWR